MVQGNLSDKQEGAVVGLHYHLHQADYWFAIAGRARVVLHDLREGSPTEGANHVVEIGSENPVGLFIPPGVAHGFASLTDVVLTYLVDAFYNPADELGLAWDDPEVGADWGLTDPVLSDRDRKNPSRAGIPAGRRPYWGLRT
ncbi:MAG: dTDP-4-dehydrorhamnose 3,5-epimerase family protein, partial [Acidimicrobiales bacterium]